MEIQSISPSLRRVTDLVEAKCAGADVHLDIEFEILPVDFHHRDYPFKAYIFLARYTGTIGKKSFAFRKCYARGCPNNLCTHVFLAVHIANRYLQRDYHALRSVGIAVGDTLFRLDEMMVKFDSRQMEGRTDLTIPQLIELAATGGPFTTTVTLEFIPAVAHFAAQKMAQTFLDCEFAATIEDHTYRSHRCLACFATDQEQKERPAAIDLANARLASIYEAFDRCGIIYDGQYFKTAFENCVRPQTLP